jgi:hypothetical protein
MPGLLRPDAVCPMCEDPLEALVDESSSDGVKRTYYHGKRHPKVRRQLPCKQTFISHVKAHLEREMLEVHAGVAH